MKAIFTTFILGLISFNTWAIEATHGMVLFGNHQLMAYHLPMFHKIHAKQVVLQYTLPEALKAELLEHQNETFLTFVPARFDLEKFLVNPFALKGDVYKGHFEQGGKLIMSDVTMENVKVLYAGSISKGQETKETYRLFGTSIDLYAVHILHGGIAKDHILKANVLWSNLQYIEKGIFLESANGLLTEGSVIKLESFNTDLTIEKTIFSDDVM